MELDVSPVVDKVAWALFEVVAPKVQLLGVAHVHALPTFIP